MELRAMGVTLSFGTPVYGIESAMAFYDQRCMIRAESTEGL